VLFIFSLGDTLAGDGFDFAGRCVRLVLGQARGAVQKRGFKCSVRLSQESKSLFVKQTAQSYVRQPTKHTPRQSSWNLSTQRKQCLPPVAQSLGVCSKPTSNEAPAVRRGFCFALRVYSFFHSTGWTRLTFWFFGVGRVSLT